MQKRRAEMKVNMTYDLQLLLCAILFISIAVFFYFSKKHLPGITDRLFTVMLLLALVNNIFDAWSSHAIMNYSSYPSGTPFLLNTLFYLSQAVFAVIGFYYALALDRTAAACKTEQAMDMGYPGRYSLYPDTDNIFTVLSFILTRGLISEVRCSLFHYFHALY